MNHLAETAKHYANLAEQYRTELVEQQQLNEDLLGLVEALCEELEIDSQVLLQEMGVISKIKGLLGKKPKPKPEPKPEPKPGSGSKPTGPGQSDEWKQTFGEN